jgi:hypothetical protein
MLNLCGIVVAILKMATDRNFSMSGIISGHHNLPTYEFSRCLPFSKWLPKHGIKMGGKNSTLSDIIKI